jgi:serine/threonine protein kinase
MLQLMTTGEDDGPPRHLVGLWDVLLPSPLAGDNDDDQFPPLLLLDELSLVTPYHGVTLQSQLREVVRREERFTHRDLVFCAVQVLCGLKYLHAAGIIHRVLIDIDFFIVFYLLFFFFQDLKPDNIVVDDAGVFKLIDYGLARSAAFDQHMTPVVGHPYYMAPEVALCLRSYDPKGGGYFVIILLFYYFINLYNLI